MHRVDRRGSVEQFHHRKRLHKFEKHRQVEAVLVLEGVRCCPVYSEPNIRGVLYGSQASLGIFGANSNGAFGASEGNNVLNATTKTGAGQSSVTFYANRCSSLYKEDLNEVRVNALYGLNLIKAF